MPEILSESISNEHETDALQSDRLSLMWLLYKVLATFQDQHAIQGVEFRRVFAKKRFFKLNIQQLNIYVTMLLISGFD